MSDDYTVLADKVSECIYEGMSPRETTDALIAAGVRPPARVITDRAEVDALPIGSVVLDPFAAACTRVHSDPLMGWVRATSAVPMGRHCHRPYLPVTVLFTPTEVTS